MEALSGHAQWAAGAGGWVWERSGGGNQTGGAAALIECGPEATSKGHGTEEVGISGQPYIQVGTRERMVREVGEEQSEAGEKDPSAPKRRGAELAKGWGRAWGQKARVGQDATPASSAGG